MKLVLSIDVEEEGLFSGAYQRNPSVKNLDQLSRLEFLSKEMGFPLTLLVSWQVANDPHCRDILKRWQDELGAEIGAHLHPWSTPPFEDLGRPEPVPSDDIPERLLRAKFETLLETLQTGLGVTPVSFRMGRWDFGRQMQTLLPQYGIQVDASIAPLRHIRGGPDRFLAPADPYWLQPVDPNGRPLFEVPLTMVPIWPSSPRVVHSLAKALPSKARQAILSNFSAVGAVGIQPVWYPAASMRWAARIHRRRKGQVLTMFLHSSELMPGQSPHFPNEDAVHRLVEKIRDFLTWLTQTGPVQGVTLSELLPKDRAGAA
ncbi:MAG: hypothetical protein LDL30_07785 [Desulfovibrio sp.]|nr:hypothetical protein [Desulfovibrio sp.]MCA1985548.1 hypothetical protein [Desulfovibrio sp.]